VRENPVPPTVVDPEIPSWADAIVLKAMAKDPNDRYQSAGEMRMDVQRAENGMAVAAPTRLDSYGRTQAMGAATMMANPTTSVPPYQYGDETSHGEEPPRRSYRALLWVLGLLVVLGAVGALAYMMFGGSGKTYAVPLVNGLPQAQAVKAVQNAHLKPTVVDQASSTTKKGNVIKSNPAEGNNVKANTVVTLYVSAGPQRVTVPNVVGQQANTASSALTAKGLTVSEVSDTASTQPKGTVTKQNPVGNTTVNPGTKITIYVSGGGVNVPSVIGDSASTAQSILQGAGFKVNAKTEAAPSTDTPGDVFAQTPSGNSSAPQGSTVTIFVAAQPVSPTPSTPNPSPSQSQPGGSPSPSASQSNPFGGLSQNGDGHGKDH
jgi:eukaryotic-like serine/threonine-protein kinase